MNNALAERWTAEKVTKQKVATEIAAEAKKAGTELAADVKKTKIKICIKKLKWKWFLKKLHSSKSMRKLLAHHYKVKAHDEVMS